MGWEDSNVPIPESAGNLKVAIFDVYGLRWSAMVAMGFPPTTLYYSLNNWILFIENLKEVATRYPEVTFFLKNKRKHRPDFVSDNKMNRVQKLISESRIVPVDHQVAAGRLIENSDAVISIPFSTPSFLAQSLGKPAIFFDPTGEVMPKRRQSVPVLGSIFELEAWLTDLLAR